MSMHVLLEVHSWRLLVIVIAMNTVSSYFLEQCCRHIFLPFPLPNLTRQEHLVGGHANDHVHIHHSSGGHVCGHAM